MQHYTDRRVATQWRACVRVELHDLHSLKQQNLSTAQRPEPFGGYGAFRFCCSNCDVCAQEIFVHVDVRSL